MEEESKKIGIIVAMEKELKQLKTLLDDARVERHGHSDFFVGHVGEKEIVLQQCGIGKVNSAVGAVEMITHYRPSVIVSSGVAGGANPSLNPFDVVVASECTYHDAYCGSEVELGQIMGMPARYKAPKALVDEALALGNPHIHTGLTVSGEWFVDSREKMQSILDHFPEAMAVDMESCSIAQTCYLYHTPFVSFRIISDVPLKDHEASQYFDFWNRIANGSFNVTKAFVERL
jgi:adenosylhomocysteine nucleosidase